MPRISTQEKYSIETWLGLVGILVQHRPYALRNYSQKDVLNVQLTEVSVHAVLDCSSVMRLMVVAKVCVECGWRKL